ncbi:MAG TPA: hypothetical protein VFO76_07645, partial [Candidatus Kapabacteria bacterium]|nr:hypothetical protein [Candidatus Kapabacteria bacterium]
VNKGLWSHKSLIGSDLCTSAGYLALVNYFEWRLSQCIRTSDSKSEQPLSGLQQLILSSRRDSINFWKRQFKRGKIHESILESAMTEILAIEANQRPKALLSNIKEECNLARNCYQERMSIIGKLIKEELVDYAGS